jgi:hypothetical protein
MEMEKKCESLARKVILTLVLPWLLVIAFPAYAYLEGWVVAGLHTLLVTAWAVLLTNIVLIRFRKLPFTCTLPVFKQHSFVSLLSIGFGFLLYAVSTPEFESSALVEPLRMLGLLPIALVAWYIPHRLAKNTIDIEKKLIFEEPPPRTVEALGLGDYGR